MPSRPGSDYARKLFESDIIELAIWEENLNLYNKAVHQVDVIKKKNGELEKLDVFWRCEYVESVKSRDKEGSFITLHELSRIMEWKLTRGKSRPLQALVDSNSEKHTISCSKKAFEYISKNNWEKAFDCLTELKGVGEATASAILAPIAPELCPFMADEVIEAACPKRDYSRKSYRMMRDALASKASQINRLIEKGERFWTAEDVGKALWAHAITSANKTESYNPTTSKKRQASPNTTKSRNKKSKS